MQAVLFLDKARRSLESGHHLLTGDFPDHADREAYLAAFHAAQAFIVNRTGKLPKAHSGTRTEFARLVRDEPRIDQRYVAFLANSYELKTLADYSIDRVPIAPEEAMEALGTAAELVDLVSRVV